MISLYPGDGFVDFSLLSRGDRIFGTLFRRSDDPELPLVLLAGPDACARSPWVRAVVNACAGFAAVASIDLPLCGARSSEKLSIQALDPEHPLADRLHDEIQAQAAADLGATLLALREAANLRPRRLGLAATGLGLRLAYGFCRETKDLAVIVLSQAPPETRRALAQAHGERLEACDEVGPLAERLRVRLGA